MQNHIVIMAGGIFNKKASRILAEFNLQMQQNSD